MNDPTIAQAVQLDQAGWLIGVDETATAYFARVAKAQTAQTALRARLANGDALETAPKIYGTAQTQIPATALAEISSATVDLYGFALTDALGFYVKRGLGFLFGGCAFFDPEKNARFFLLRDDFRRREKYLYLYDRREILAHESCHVARAPLNDNEFEEHFAYQTSPAKFRRTFGGCFREPHDALSIAAAALGILLLIALVQVLLATNLPFFGGDKKILWWISELNGLPLLVIGGWLIYRNYRSRGVIAAATKILHAANIAQPAAVLFRCSAPEIKELSRLKNATEVADYLAPKIARDFRWQVINARFMNLP